MGVTGDAGYGRYTVCHVTDLTCRGRGATVHLWWSDSESLGDMTEMEGRCLE